MDNVGGEDSRGTFGIPGPVRGFDPWRQPNLDPLDFHIARDAMRAMGMANVLAIKPDDSWRLQSIAREQVGYDPRNHTGSRA